ncbi:response regulator [Aquabacterium sp.]|uniref:response regulator n=1 Tax=Aquabacterium sp. TaxID=1872578 RepID=UPI003784CEDC
MRVLLVEDNATLCTALSDGLGQAGLVVDAIGAAEPADAALRSTAYDLVILDIGLPRMSGLDLLRAMRARGQDVPVLMLTARDTLEDRVRGLNEGADDYLVKPFLMPELVARCQALIRRSRAAASSVLDFGPLQLDLGRHVARMAGRELPLTPREWDLLQHLMLAAPNVAPKQKLTDSLSAWDKEITPNAVEICASRLRAKLDGNGVLLRSVRGLGYRLELATGRPDPAGDAG